MSRHHIRTTPIIAAIAAAILVLAGCSRQVEQPNDQAPIEQPVQDEPAPSNNVDLEMPQAPAENAAEVHEIKVPPPPPVSREAQMLDDAAASGMTARLPHGNDGASDAGGGNQNNAD